MVFPRVALTVAWIGPSKPFWVSMGDALQWFGFALIVACSASVVWVARWRASEATRPMAV